MERWMDIRDFEGLYQISDHGNVKTLRKANRTINSGVKVPGLASVGYHQVQLTRADKTRSCLYVHRLVGIHFVPNPENKPKINHKDGNKLNNHFSNLEWCTQLQNVHHAIDNGLFGRINQINRLKKRKTA